MGDWFQKRENVTNIEKGNEKLESDLKKVKKDYSKSQRDFTKVESEIREKDNLLQKKKPVFIKAKEKTSHIINKIKSSNVSLEQAKKAYIAHESEVQELETEMQAGETKKIEFMEKIESESMEQ